MLVTFRDAKCPEADLGLLEAGLACSVAELTTNNCSLHVTSLHFKGSPVNERKQGETLGSLCVIDL